MEIAEVSERFDISSMHVSIVEQLDGTGAEWMEHVSDEQYLPGSETEQM